ncbi:site-2 protease family protein [bacterium]|nr:site-2 protease family protein [bacterium]
MSIFTLLFLLPVLLLALSIHEFAHAYAADKLGDATPRMMGRVTLNPLKHLDPVGTALLVITALIPGPTFGWGKPVIFNPYNLKNPKRDTGIIAFAGPLSNIAMALLGFGTLYIGFGTIPEVLIAIILQFIIINVVLATFNLIPIYPLDGFNVISSILPNELSEQFKETYRYGTIILLLLIFTGTTGKILGPVINFTYNLLSRFI